DRRGHEAWRCGLEGNRRRPDRAQTSRTTGGDTQTLSAGEDDQTVRRAALGTATLALVASGCAHSPPTINGVAPTPAAPSTLWNPPAPVVAAGARDMVGLVNSSTTPRQLTLAQVVDIALRNSPATKVSWTQARAAADVYGSTEGRALFPTILG